MNGFDQMKVWEDAFAAGMTLVFKLGSLGPFLGGKAFRRTFPRRKASSISSLIHIAPLPLTPALSLGERETRSPLGRKTRGGMDESRMRFPRRQQSCFLLPEGEGQDEGEGGAPWPNRALSYEPAFPIHQSTNPIIPFPVFPCND
jgi:hypothetical protein